MTGSETIITLKIGRRGLIFILAALTAFLSQNISIAVGTQRALPVTSPCKETLIVSEASNVTNGSMVIQSQDAEKSNDVECGLRFPPDVKSAIFYPKRFMEEGGSGQHFLPSYRKMEEADFERAIERPRLNVISYQAPSATSMCKTVYYHIHKCGSTTVKAATKKSPLTTTKLYAYDLEYKIGKEKYGKRVRNILENTYANQQQTNQTTRVERPVFTFIRDPVSRFVSGLAQFIKLLKFYPVHPLTTCVENNENETIALLECAIDAIHNKSSYLNVHLLPQVYELYKGTTYGGDNMDLAVHLVDLKDLEAALSPLVGLTSDEIVPKQQASGVQRGFNLTPSILTPELVNKICKLYAMDVLMMRETGISHSVCMEI